MRFRKPSFKKRIAARTSVRRAIRHSLGVKAPRGMGWFTNPRRAVYNRIYNRTTTGLGIVGYLFGILLIVILFFIQFIIENPWVLAIAILFGLVIWLLNKSNAPVQQDIAIANPIPNSDPSLQLDIDTDLDEDIARNFPYGYSQHDELVSWISKVQALIQKAQKWGPKFVEDIDERAEAIKTTDDVDLLKQRLRVYLDDLRNFKNVIDLYKSDLSKMVDRNTSLFRQGEETLNSLDDGVNSQILEIDRIEKEIDRQVREQTNNL